jgi:hypothetical protein
MLHRARGRASSALAVNEVKLSVNSAPSRSFGCSREAVKLTETFRKE